jgi:Leucine-rich repeat (LRR) protein
MFGVLIISLLCCFQLGLSDKLLVCQVSGDACVFTSKFLENNEKAIIVADHTAQGSSNADIKNVTFVSSSIHQIPAELFSTFPNLGTLKMEGQNLQELKPNTFKNAKNLRSLYLGFNKIKLIDETTFDGAGSLSGIWIEKNTIQTVHKNAFRNLRNLVHLGLWSNQIRELHPEIFYGNPNLGGLSFSGNKLQTLHKDIFSKNLNLGGLWLQSNKFNALSNTMFSHLKNLGILYLNENNCVNIGYGKEAASHMAKFEAALRDCTISYLSLENDELKSELNEIRADSKKIMKALNIQ